MYFLKCSQKIKICTYFMYLLYMYMYTYAIYVPNTVQWFRKVYMLKKKVFFFKIRYVPYKQYDGPGK